MAAQPPPAPIDTQAPPAANPQALPPAKAGRSCFGCGCGGCLIAIVLVVLLVVGGGYYLFVIQAQAAVPSPAALVVVTTPVDVDTNNSGGFHPARPGQEMLAGNSARTGDGGHATIQFPDGSYVRMAPKTVVTLTAAQLTLQAAWPYEGVAGIPQLLARHGATKRAVLAAGDFMFAHREGALNNSLMLRRFAANHGLGQIFALLFGRCATEQHFPTRDHDHRRANPAIAELIARLQC